MKTKQKKRLQLSRETVAILEHGDLVKAVGGTYNTIWCYNSNYNGGWNSCGRLTDECCPEV